MALHLTKKDEYALAGLYYLAFVKPRQFVQVRTIANATGVPKRFLEQIFLLLREHKLLESRRGSHGGYRLLIQPERLSLAALFEILSEPKQPQPAAITGTGANYFVWRANHAIWDNLKQISLAHLIDAPLQTHIGELSRKTTMYYI